MGEVHHLPVPGRAFFIDDGGRVLRASWHHDLGMVNLSVWQGDRCTDSFQLPAHDAARLIGFLADGLAATVAVATPPAAPAFAGVGASIGARFRRLVRRAGAR
jgi:hypothetical protein